jgi:hypothetical protein
MISRMIITHGINYHVEVFVSIAHFVLWTADMRMGACALTQPHTSEFLDYFMIVAICNCKHDYKSGEMSKDLQHNSV